MIGIRKRQDRMGGDPYINLCLKLLNGSRIDPLDDRLWQDIKLYVNLNNPNCEPFFIACLVGDWLIQDFTRAVRDLELKDLRLCPDCLISTYSVERRCDICCTNLV